MSNELIVLLSEKGQPVGSAPKLESHHSHTPLHQGFSCYLFNKDGEFLLTQRAKSKKVWPGVWTNSVCGHPAPGEAIEDAIARRANYELGISEVRNLRIVLSDYRYKTPPFKGIVENEICPVYFGLINDDFHPNKDEVEDFKWVSWSDLKEIINKDPDSYSYWFQDQLKLLPKN
jgi:isopentenyl-diphosphate delta-isomerase